MPKMIDKKKYDKKKHILCCVVLCLCVCVIWCFSSASGVDGSPCLFGCDEGDDALMLL
jgi:hypothetical protein